MSAPTVVKLGGSLLEAADPPPLLEVLAARAETGQSLLVVPGGGGLADAVRAACRRHAPGDTAAHWMAVLAMDQHAHLLCGLCPRATLARDANEVAAALRSRRLPVLAPYAWLRTTDSLPHSWDVTSDSIAAWIAAQLRAPRLVLLKSVEGIGDGGKGIVREVTRDRLRHVPEVDAAFADWLDPETECWIVSGRHPDRLRTLLERGRCEGTRVRRVPGPHGPPVHASR